MAHLHNIDPAKYGRRFHGAHPIQLSTRHRRILSSAYNIQDIQDVPVKLALSDDAADKFLKKAASAIKLCPDRYLYYRTRAMSSIEDSGPNLNHDGFLGNDLRDRFKTFIGSAVFVDHDNGDFDNNKIGIVYDSALRPSVFHPDDPKAVYVDNICILDVLKAEKKFPGLATLITGGVVTDTSMGCVAAYSVCSICGKQIYDMNDFCVHLEDKAERLRYGALSRDTYEIVKDFLFFEDSVITTQAPIGGGADPYAKIMKVYQGHKTIEASVPAINNIIEKYNSDYDNKDFWNEYLESGSSRIGQELIKKTASPIVNDTTCNTKPVILHGSEADIFKEANSKIREAQSLLANYAKVELAAYRSSEDNPYFTPPPEANEIPLEFDAPFHGKIKDIKLESVDTARTAEEEELLKTDIPVAVDLVMDTKDSDDDKDWQDEFGYIPERWK